MARALRGNPACFNVRNVPDFCISRKNRTFVKISVMMLKIAYYIYLVCIALPVLLTATILTALLTSIFSIIFGGRWWGYYPPRLWARLFCLMTFVRVEVKGRENYSPDQSYVFVANHQGAYDIFAIYGYLNHNFKWMMKKSLEKIPLVGFACRRAGHVFVDNSGFDAIKNTMAKAKHELQDGMSLVVFPEGSRTKTGKMGRFKRGAYQLAMDFGLPVVPITINGAFEVMPRTSLIPRPGKIVLTIHKPVPAPTDESQIRHTMSQTYDAVYSALEAQYK